ncbi:hypothetical protein NQ318_009844 [Aromia moschata]|uniref:Uncharacterized protein n=1 Tax=Aromia moschata TaxID=1265417 RepID=A0AAV8XEV5_9CUCU|nr:hypothetical protein NQ318_009844 [Aromia moschata]
MDENTEASSANVPESPKPLAFTIDFGSNKNVDVQRQKALAEKLQKRHKRGQSLSKFEDTVSTPPTKQHPLTGNLPRKSSFQSEGYFSSDEKNDRAKSAKGSAKRSELTLLLKNVASDKMTQSFPNAALPSITSPEEIELKDVSSPELDLISPFSPKEQSNTTSVCNVKKQFSSPESENLDVGKNNEKDSVFVDGAEFDFDKSDTVSDAGTYTLDADNYSEEQKARMSIDREFKIEQLSVQKKTEEYVKSLSTMRDHVLLNTSQVAPGNKSNVKETEVTTGVQALNFLDKNELKSPKSPTVRVFEKLASTPTQPKNTLGKALSPIMSPTQNMSITQEIEDKTEKQLNNSECDLHDKTFTKIMFPSPKAKRDGLEQAFDQGSVISVTSSGAFKPKNEKKLERKYSLTKSEVQVQAYIDGKNYTDGIVEPVCDKEFIKRNKPKLTANIVNVQSIELAARQNRKRTVSDKISEHPEMRRKSFQPEIKHERAISVDRKPMKTNDIQSRYLLNISKRGTPPPSAKVEVKNVPKVGSATKTNPNRPQTFSRTDSGRFSMRTTKPPVTNNTPKGLKKDTGGM